MGYELDRLIKQYGVGTASRAAYAGAQMPTDSTAANYNQDLQRYQQDRQIYDQYVQNYQNRISQAPMYAQQQFQTNPDLSAGMQSATREGGIGADKYNQNIRDWVNNNPFSSPGQVRAEQAKWGISNQDVMNATGNWYGTSLPTYGVTPASEDPSALVRQAYASVGRTGFGSGFSQIDPAGYDYWVNTLKTGASTPEAFQRNFQTAIQDQLTNKPNDPYSQYVRDWLSKNDPQSPMLSPTTPPATGPNVPTPTVPDDRRTTLDANTGADNTFEAQVVVYGPDGTMYTSPSAARRAGVTNYTLFPPSNTGGNTGGGNGDYYNPNVNPNNGLNLTDAALPTFNQGAYTPTLTPPVFNPVTTPTQPVFDYGGGGRDFNERDNIQLYKSGGRVRDVMRKYAVGGAVNGYQTGGLKREDEENGGQTFPVAPQPNIVSTPLPPEQTAAPMPVTPAAMITPAAATEMLPPPAPAVAAAPLDPRTAGLQSLLEKYGPQDSGYAGEVKAARARSEAETKAFTEMIDRMMKSPEDAQSSKAEMYFRLAAAFGSPTRTGHFSENLGLVGKELADYSKSQRASAAEKRNLALEVQKMKMGAAKEDLAAVRSLAGEEMKDRRAIAQELIKDYIQSGKPQSSAGKTAMDEGLQPGSPEFQKRVGQLAELDVQRQMAGISNQLANLTLAQANLTLRQNQAARLSPTEIKLKVEAEDLVANGKQALQDLAEAYRLNPNSLAGSWLEKGQQFLYEAAGSNDPTIVNTRVINNLLGSQGLAKLRATFGGNPTEGERAILLELEGIGSKTKEERATIMRRAYRTLQDRVAREQRRLDDINSGAYRTTEPMPGEQ